MKHLFICCLFLIFALTTNAQPSREVTGPEADFLNKITSGMLNSLPKEFKGWDVNFPNFTPAVAGVTRMDNCDRGKDCFWTYDFHAVYDGTSVPGPDLDKFRDSMKTITFDWHYVALMSRYTNTHQLVVDIGVNETSMIGEFKYCLTGYKTLPPPPGFDHYIFASVNSCFPKSARGNISDVNLFTMLLAPVVKAHDETEYTQGDVFFTMNHELPTPYKVQNVVVRIYGSKALAKEFLQQMNLEELKKLIK